MAILIIGIFGGGGMAGGGGGTGNTGLMIAGIVLGALGFIGGFVLGQGSVFYIQNLKESYARDVRNKLDQLLMPINAKYNGQIQFSTRIGSSFPKNATVQQIYIDIAIHVEYVRYLKESPQAQIQTIQVIQQQPQPQPQVIMVQLPDGRMVPAQVTGVVQPMQMQQNLNQVPAYNPHMNQVVEEQNEGEGGTNDGNINAPKTTGEVYQ